MVDWFLIFCGKVGMPYSALLLSISFSLVNLKLYKQEKESKGEICLAFTSAYFLQLFSKAPSTDCMHLQEHIIASKIKDKFWELIRIKMLSRFMSIETIRTDYIRTYWKSFGLIKKYSNIKFWCLRFWKVGQIDNFSALTSNDNGNINDEMSVK